MRRWIPIGAFVALAAMAAVALAQVGGTSRAKAAAIATTGSFEISNSDEGQPIFSASGIAPGGAAQGTVAIEDTGSDPVALHLRRGELEDVPGFGGGLLSGRLRLTVLEITGPATTRTVYEGPLDTMPEQAVGRLEGGEARTFEFTATLPDTGAATFQNAVQGASTTVDYAWVATEVEEPAEPEEERRGPSGSAGTSVTPSGGGQNTGGEGDGGLDLLKLTVPKIRPVLRAGHILAWAICDRTCRIYVRGRIRAAGHGKHRGAKIQFAKTRAHGAGGQRVRIPVPRKLRRWMREHPGREHLRARLRFVAVGTDGQRDTVRKTVKLRTRRHR